MVKIHVVLAQPNVQHVLAMRRAPYVVAIIEKHSGRTSILFRLMVPNDMHRRMGSERGIIGRTSAAVECLINKQNVGVAPRINSRTCTVDRPIDRVIFVRRRYCTLDGATDMCNRETLLSRAYILSPT